MKALVSKIGILDLPQWKPGPDEVTVKLSVCLPLGPSEGANYIRQSRSILRVFKYFFSDGPWETRRKILSRKMEETTRGSRELVLVAGHLGNHNKSEFPVLAIGTRHPQWVKVAPFHRNLVFRIPPGGHPFEDLLAFVYLAGLPFNKLELAQEYETIKALRRWLEPLAGYDPACGEVPPIPKGLTLERVLWAVQRSRETPIINLLKDKVLDERCIPPPESHFKPRREHLKGSPRFALIGAGNYARTQAVFHLRAAGACPIWVVDRDPVCASVVKDNIGAINCGTDPDEAINSEEITLVVITTYHDTHQSLACQALSKGKAVFIEKPPATTRSQLEALFTSCSEKNKKWRIGYNRRYSPWIVRAVEALANENGPVTVNCIIREAYIPRKHWYYWPNQGTRIAGNICHWIDLGYLLCDKAMPVSLTLSAPVSSGRRDDEVCISVLYDNGSICNIIGTSRGDDTLGVEEFIEARRGGTTFTIRDFRFAELKRRGFLARRWYGFRNRGHREMYRSAACWARGEMSLEPLSYGLEDLWVPNVLTLLASEMAASGESCIQLSKNNLIFPLSNSIIKI